MQVTLLDPQSPTWAADLDRLYAQLGGAHNPTLFPYHFLQVVLTYIGGQIAVIRANGAEVAIGFLFPRTLHAGQKAYTLRFHPLVNDATLRPSDVQKQMENLLNGARIYWYDPAAPQHYAPTHQTIGKIDIGRPDQNEAQAIRSLQQQIWGSTPGFLYPADIHSQDFGLGTSLVARIEGKTAGFLFGFYKFGGSPLPTDWTERFNGALRLESQTLGVLPEYRGLRLGFLLKQAQAENALAQGIQLINWTVDPLQYPNAMLNFGRLGGVAFDFTPDYYPSFRNDLNRMPASRFSITWLVGTARVQQSLAGGTSTNVIDLAEQPAIGRVNHDWSHVDYGVNAPQIAIEIPANWTALQRDDLAEATNWRSATDLLFQHYIGRNVGQYGVTAVGMDGARRYLIAERLDVALWERLGAV